MKKVILIILTELVLDGCAQPVSEKEDSLEYVANYFLVHDVYKNSYYCTERDIEELVRDHSEWVEKYFPIILKEYDLTLLTQFQIAIELYKKDEKSYLDDLWKKYSRLKGNTEFSPILKELSFQKILLDK